MAVGMMLTGTVTPAMAAPAGASGVTGSITVNNVQPGAIVTAYRIIAVNYMDEGSGDMHSYIPTDPQYTWDVEVAGWVRKYGQVNKLSYIGDDDRVTEDFTLLKNDDMGLPDPYGSTSDIARFMDRLSSDLSNKIQRMERVTAKGSDDLREDGMPTGSAVLTNLPVGGYLLIIRNHSDQYGSVGDWTYRPMFTAVDFQTGTDGSWSIDSPMIHAKPSRAGIDKSVNEKIPGHDNGKAMSDTGSDSVGVGDGVRFDLRTDVPVFPVDAVDKSYVIADHMDTALTPDPDGIKVYGYTGTDKFPTDGSDERPENLLKAGDDYTLTTDTTDLDADDNAATWRLDFTDTYERIRQYPYLHVIYTATVNSNATPGTPILNRAKLQYANNPYEMNSHRTVMDRVRVYTYGINLLKTFHENGRPAANIPDGARFSVTRKTGSTPLRFVKDDDAAGGYRLATDADKETLDSLPIDAMGRLLIKGLDEGDYLLTETATPVGYAKPSKPVPIAITPSQGTDDQLDGDVTNGTPDADHADITPMPGYSFISIDNVKSNGLPQTGGLGVFIGLAAGLILIGLGVGLWAVERSRRKDPSCD
ncbi:isopeptide-forming domain-containing fimbrial protein [Bifidobacterium felsineum]|uniref:isopeptide-forming domain-containing fimbrial protein n=1 Tax=Bifidobacterium felsineum TaxID=2045440 RepID=UPI001BDBC159|nr:isopeptide-forming domain-containing fimbrial protein [Bifidobacterium felsineum]MBT1164675.1 isopeptide-forming domain-containing fimbrial protein [Bifidobacterium felsineum]